MGMNEDRVENRAVGGDSPLDKKRSRFLDPKMRAPPFSDNNASFPIVKQYREGDSETVPRGKDSEQVP